MTRKFVQVFSLSASVFFVAVMLVQLLTLDSKAQRAEGCEIQICASIPGLPPPESKEDAVFFEFEYTGSSGSEIFENVANVDKCPIVGVEEGSEATIIELPRQAWGLESVGCDGDGFSVTPVENGISIACQNESLGGGTCTFVNQRASVNVPTMSEWGMMGVAGALGLIGVFYAARRRKAAA